MRSLWERSRGEAALALSLAVLSVGFTAYLSVGNSHFYGDDFWLFAEYRNLSFAEFLLTPINVHFVPLHRLFTALIYQIAPLDFRLAVGIMAAFHVLGVVFLYKTLQQLHNSPANAWLTLVYASNVYLGALLFWWAPGILRLPYIFFAIASIYNYLCFRRTHAASRLLLVIVCFSASLGFFSKAVLIPAYMLGIEICLFDRSKTSSLLRNAMCIGAVAIVGILYIGFAQTLMVPGTLKLNFDIATHLSAQSVFLAVVQQGALGVIADFPASTLNTSISILWLIAIAASVVMVPRNAVVWGVGLTLLALNVQMIAMSTRMVLVAEKLANVHRYYFDLMFVGALFLSLVIHNFDAARKWAHSDRLRRILHWGGVTLALGVVAMAHVSFVGVLDAQNRFFGRSVPHLYEPVKRYVDNVGRGLAKLSREHPGGFTVAEGRVPLFVLGLQIEHVGRYSQFLPLFGYDSVNVVNVRDARYLISESGRIVENSDRSNP